VLDVVHAAGEGALGRQQHAPLHLLRLEASLRYRFSLAWSASLNYAYEAFHKHDWRTDTINPFVPGNSAVYLGNDLKSYEAHIFGVTVGYTFK